ncbi:MAG: hypothetical protein KA795_14315 [Burkholderiaceae bacterium]|nr:hypothetical protein [Burkholderiaceae bacterium]
MTTPRMPALPAVVLAFALALAGCSSSAPTPEWQMNAKSALDRATAAWLEGNSRVADAEFARARAEAARTGRVELVARIELTRCAARVAALDLAACTGFESLRADAPAAERAYADYLAGRVDGAGIALLPAQHRAVAAGGQAAVAAVEDPLARLVAAGVMFARGEASPATVELAVDTASAQGWRRALLAWLGVQARLADQAGDAQAAERVRRRIALVEGR